MSDSSTNYPIISYLGESDGSIVLEGKSSPTELLNNWPLVLRGLLLETAGYRTTGWGPVIDSNGYWIGQPISDSAAPVPTYYIRNDGADSAVGPITVDNGIISSSITTFDSAAIGGRLTVGGAVNLVPASGTSYMNVKAAAANAYVRLENTTSTIKWNITNSPGAGDQFKIENYDGAAWTIPVKITNSAPDDSLVIDASGDIGFGTSTPSVPLHIIGTSGATAGASFASQTDLAIDDTTHANITLMSNATDGIGSIYFADPGNAAVGYIAYFHNSNGMSFITQASESMRLIGNQMIVGNVASNPAATLDVRAALAGVQIKSSANQADLYFSSLDTQENRIFFGDVSDWDVASIKYSHSTDIMSFTTGARGTADLIIDSGDVTIAGTVNATKFVGHDFYSAYSNATLTLTTSYQVVPIDTALKSSDGAVFSLSSGRLTVNKTGTFMITMDVTSNITSGAARSETQIELFKNAAAVTGTFAAIYNRTLGRGQATGSSSVILDLTSGDIIDIRALKVGTDAIDTVSGGCRLLVKEL